MTILSTFPSFLAYFTSSFVMLATALYIYKLITPYDEIALIRAGNVAAAVGYAGTVLGMTITMSSVVVNSTGWLDKIVWCAIGLAFQLGMWAVMNRVLGNLHQRIAADGCMASAVMMFATSVGVGILQYACLTY
jgi:putative membrane protein